MLMPSRNLSVIHTTRIFVVREWNGIKSTNTSTWKHARYVGRIPGLVENNGGPYIECIVWWPRRVKLEQQWLYYYMQAWRWNGNKDSIREPCPYIEMFLKKSLKNVKFRQLMLHLKVVHEQLPVFVEGGWWNINDASTCEFGPRIADIVGCRTGVTS